MADVIQFFRRKKPWSRYKDLILSYYLHPYLTKVKRLKKPIAVIDCFAGAGRYEDGTEGSPLIIANELNNFHKQNIEVLGVFIEADAQLFQRLRANLAGAQFPNEIYSGSFRDFSQRLAQIARSHTTFVYVDPIQPGHLLFNDLASVYEALRTGQSVETLINFLVFGFLRRAKGLMARLQSPLQNDHPEVAACNAIAGGDYWQSILSSASRNEREMIDEIARGYTNRLRRWFNWVLHYPIRRKYNSRLPRYHLTFGSRHPDAVDLMNSAMVKARREFVGAEFVSGRLFDVRPRAEDIDPIEARNVVVKTARRIGRTTWKLLRIHATIDSPSRFNESEFNRAIKEAIARGELSSSASGKKIEETAMIWPKD